MNPRKEVHQEDQATPPHLHQYNVHPNSNLNGQSSSSQVDGHYSESSIVMTYDQHSSAASDVVTL
jgi:hypothetical protein